MNGIYRNVVLIQRAYFLYFTNMQAANMGRDTSDPITLIGLTASHEWPTPMVKPHRHNDVELNLVETGSTTYFFGGTRATFQEGHLVLFWGAMPHQLVAVAPGTRYFCLTLPLALFLQWPLPEALMRRFFAGEPVVENTVDNMQFDCHLLGRWCNDLDQASASLRAIVVLEIEARVRRLASAPGTNCATPIPSVQPGSLPRAPLESPAVPGSHAERSMRSSGEPMAYVARMAQCLVDHYAESLSLAGVAHEVGLSLNYAMALFREHFGMTMGTFLTQYRVANAQRLLLTTEMSMLSIAMAVGFGSVSRFYVAFRNQCGCPPGAYRNHMQHFIQAAGDQD